MRQKRSFAALSGEAAVKEEDSALAVFMASQMLRLQAAAADVVPFPGLSLLDTDFLNFAMPFVRKTLDKRSKLQHPNPSASSSSKPLLIFQRLQANAGSMAALYAENVEDIGTSPSPAGWHLLLVRHGVLPVMTPMLLSEEWIRGSFRKVASKPGDLDALAQTEGTSFSLAYRQAGLLCPPTLLLICKLVQLVSLDGWILEPTFSCCCQPCDPMQRRRSQRLTQPRNLSSLSLPHR